MVDQGVDPSRGIDFVIECALDGSVTVSTKLVPASFVPDTEYVELFVDELM